MRDDVTARRRTVPTVHRRDDELEFGRVLAFSDGVFAIAITLLVLSIDIPPIPDSALDSGLPAQLSGAGGELFAYLLSFAVVGRTWLHHHRLLSELAGFDSTLIVLNLMVLCFVALLPVPTELLGEYGDRFWGVWPYAICITLVTLSLGAMFEYARRRDLLRGGPVTPTELRRARITVLLPAGVFLGSIGLALVSPMAATLSWLLIFTRRWMIRHA